MKNDFCSTTVASGPRGSYYEWCRLLDNGTLAFGDEQGNYCGGITLNYTWYGKRNGLLSEDHTPTREYWDEVRKKMEYYKNKNPKFYDDIIKMCADHGVDILKRIEDKIVL